MFRCSDFHSVAINILAVANALSTQILSLSKLGYLLKSYHFLYCTLLSQKDRDQLAHWSETAKQLNGSNINIEQLLLSYN